MHPQTVRWRDKNFIFHFYYYQLKSNDLNHYYVVLNLPLDPLISFGAEFLMFDILGEFLEFETKFYSSHFHVSQTIRLFRAGISSAFEELQALYQCVESNRIFSEAGTVKFIT